MRMKVKKRKQLWVVQFPDGILWGFYNLMDAYQIARFFSECSLEFVHCFEQTLFQVSFGIGNKKGMSNDQRSLAEKKGAGLD